MNAYLDLVGWRLLDGFDISGPCALELPDVLLRAIRIAAEGRDAEASNVDEQIAACAARSPRSTASEFDELLGEARLTYRIRDERGVFSDIWASGLMRRAVLAAGRRLADAGRISEPEHLVDATVEEMCALLTGAGSPQRRGAGRTAPSTGARTAPRKRRRCSASPPTPPPDPSGLPPARRRA